MGALPADPFVSAVMPTRGRRDWAHQALECYLAQTYQHRELVILDDAAEPSFADDPKLDGIRYERHASRLIPEKRNILCRMAAGPLICNFDSDDLSAPSRMADQVKRLVQSGMAMTAYNRMFFEAGDKVIEWVGYVLAGSGTSLMFRKDWWEQHPYPEDVSLSSDMQFIRYARDRNQLICAPSRNLMIARIHGGNSNRKNPENPIFRKASRSALPEWFPA